MKLENVTHTLAFLFSKEDINLAMKKRGFGEGKWNGLGGKIEKKEESIDCIAREVKDESTLIIPKHLFKHLGFIDFYFDDKPEFNQRVDIYRVDDFPGEPKETEEMTKLQPFKIEEIPYKEMWVGDDKWLPYVINNKFLLGEMHFINGGKELVSWVNHYSEIEKIKLK